MKELEIMEKYTFEEIQYNVNEANGPVTRLVSKHPLPEILTWVANEKARANELHKLELLIYLAPRHVQRAGESAEETKKGIEQNNKQRDEFTKKVKNV